MSLEQQIKTGYYDQLAWLAMSSTQNSSQSDGAALTSLCHWERGHSWKAERKQQRERQKKKRKRERKRGTEQRQKALRKKSGKLGREREKELMLTSCPPTHIAACSGLCSIGPPLWDICESSGRETRPRNMVMYKPLYVSFPPPHKLLCPDKHTHTPLSRQKSWGNALLEDEERNPGQCGYWHLMGNRC